MGTITASTELSVVNRELAEPFGLDLDPDYDLQQPCEISPDYSSGGYSQLQAGQAALRLFCSAAMAGSATIIYQDGVAFSRGGRVSVVQDETLTFDGATSARIQYWYDSPTVTTLASSGFYDAEGNAVADPVYYSDRGEFRSPVPVWGVFVVQYHPHFTQFAGVYSFDATDITVDVDAQTTKAIDNAPSLIVIRSGRKIATTRFSREYSVVECSNTRDVLYKRKLDIYRVFPSDPNATSEEPDPDPVTGRTDYMDVEVPTRETFAVYQVREYDDAGNVQCKSSLLRYNNKTPEITIPANSRKIEEGRVVFGDDFGGEIIPGNPL